MEPKEIYVAPLQDHNVILRVPWFYRNYAKLIFQERLITLAQDIVICTHKKGDAIPLVNHIAFEKSMKSSFSSYMIFVQDLKLKNANEPTSKIDASLKSSLDEHALFF